MKYVIKKYKLLFILYIPFFIFVLTICLYKTNFSATTTGGIQNLDSIFEVENDNKISGTLNSVFVYDTDKISIFQKWVTTIDKNATVYEPSKNYSLFTTSETQTMGIIQKNQSIEASVIKAYSDAKEIDSTINLDYEFLGLIVNYYTNSSSMQFKLGDIITKINGVNASDGEDNLYNAYIGMYEGSSVEILRDNKILTLNINQDSANYKKDNKTYSNISVYRKYSVLYENATPKLTIHAVNSSGPSAGFMQTLEIYSHLTNIDITNGKTIVGTGTIDIKGNIGSIGGIEQKVVAAFKNKASIFLCPESNYEDAYNQYLKLGSKRKRMKLISVKTFSEALEALKNV